MWVCNEDGVESKFGFKFWDIEFCLSKVLIICYGIEMFFIFLEFIKLEKDRKILRDGI